jgi:uncharacterized protein (DUF1778 family)
LDDRRRNSRIGARLPSGDRVLLKRICNSRGEDLSDFIRRAIRTEMAKLSFLKPLDKKALGLQVEHQCARKVVKN